MTIDASNFNSKPSKRWWFELRFKVGRWLRAELKAKRQSSDGSSALVQDPAKALPPPPR